MSGISTVVGKIRKIEMTQEKAKEILISKGNTVDDDMDYIDELLDEYYDDYLQIGDNFYEVLNIDYMEDGDGFYKACRSEDNTIDFLVQYHNGGCSLGEAIEEAIEDMELGEGK